MRVLPHEEGAAGLRSILAAVVDGRELRAAPHEFEDAPAQGIAAAAITY